MTRSTNASPPTTITRRTLASATLRVWRLRTACGSSGSKRRVSHRRRGLGQDRQGEADRGAATVAGLREHGATVRLDDVANDRQPEARTGEAARRNRAVETVEDVRQVGGGYPGSTIADRHATVCNAHVDGPGSAG